MLLLRLPEWCAWAWVYVSLEHTNTYSHGEMYHCFPGVGSSILRLWILVNIFKFGCKGAECLKTLVMFPLRGAFLSAQSRGMVSSIRCAVFPLRIIQDISSSGAFLLMLEKSFYLPLPWVTLESKGNALLKHSLLLNISLFSCNYNFVVTGW